MANLKIWQLTLYGNKGYTVRAESISKALQTAFKKGINTKKVYMIKQVPFHPYKLKDDDMANEKIDLPTRPEVSV